MSHVLEHLCAVDDVEARVVERQVHAVERVELDIGARAHAHLGRIREVHPHPPGFRRQAAEYLDRPAGPTAHVQHGRRLSSANRGAGHVLCQGLARVVTRQALTEQLAKVIADHWAPQSSSRGAHRLSGRFLSPGRSPGRAGEPGAMGDLVVKRTLVKSPPELWSEVSDLERLAHHLGELGEIRISRLDPERTVAWEGEHTRGTVEIEASGWGTRVILTAEVEDAESESASVASSTEAVQSERRPEPDLAAPPADASSESERADAGARTEDAAPMGVDPASPQAEQPEAETKDGGATESVPSGPRPGLSGFLSRWLFKQRREEPVPTRRPVPAPGAYRPDPDPEAEPGPSRRPRRSPSRRRS